MISGGIIEDIISAGSDLIGGAIGSLFGDDEPETGYGSKEYGTEARRMRFGSALGRQIAMGDPTAAAYLRSKVKTDPDLVNRFVDDFGADFRTTDTFAFPTFYFAGAPLSHGQQLLNNTM